MRVHLVKKTTLENYTRLNTQMTVPSEDWLTKLNNADWEAPGDIKKTYNSADLLGKGSNRVIFDIGGNNYRMICNMYSERSRFIYLFAG